MKKYSALFIMVITFFQPAFAENPANSLTMLLGIIQTLQANFSQKISDNKGKILESSKGLLSLERTGKFRWEVNQPTKQLIVANGTRLWIYDPDLAQVTIRHLTTEIGTSPALLLSDPNLALVKDFEVTVGSQSTPQVQWFILKPKNKDSMFATIQLAFNRHFEITRMILEDQLGHTTAVIFKDVEMNRPLSASLFNFKIPPHVDIIDETKK